MDGKAWRVNAVILLGIMALCVAGWLAYLALAPKTPSAPPAPAPAPAQSAAPQKTGPSAPVFDVVRVDAQGNTVLAGRATPGATVTVKDNGAVIGTAVADAQGAFVILPEKPLPAGAQSITLSEKRADGSVVQSQETASIDVPVGGGPALAVLSGPNGSTVLSGQGPKA
ncbi:MAG TPA: Ig-like domain-containing protein, partial [Acidocella sp.]|nr:Ig-like domain-containing protein [Acidocella sp.]